MKANSVNYASFPASIAPSTARVEDQYQGFPVRKPLRITSPSIQAYVKEHPGRRGPSCGNPRSNSSIHPSMLHLHPPAARQVPSAGQATRRMMVERLSPSGASLNVQQRAGRRAMVLAASDYFVHTRESKGFVV
mmetsp:Transcript_4101/g.6791  ORF Transcript_4101/g.6791 Transcript_4101/m.6791 type:complete len:134 (-) Transcript_4101:8-409(-)